MQQIPELHVNTKLLPMKKVKNGGGQKRKGNSLHVYCYGQLFSQNLS